MNEVDAWLYFDGPEPASVRPLLAALRELPPATAEDRARAVARFRAFLDAQPGAPKPAPAPPPPLPVTPPGEVVIARAGRMVVEAAEPEVIVGPFAPESQYGIEGGGVDGDAEDAAPLRLEDRLAATGPSLNLPAVVWQARGQLPFREPSPHDPKAARTMQVPVLRVPGAETAPSGNDAIARAVAALPFEGSMTSAGEVPIPRLTVEQYASLCVELMVWAGHEAWVFERYKVLHDAARRALDARWAKVLAEDPGTRAAFERAREVYRRHLTGGR